MKKILISLVLAVVMSLGATQGTISAFAETERKIKQNEETPIAQIANDDYVPYDYSNKAKKTADTYNNSVSQADAVNNLTQLVESAGGYVETYASEKEYTEAKSLSTDKVAAYADETNEDVKQIITVMTTATGSEKNGNYVGSKPVANAIVRINGVPRYTDRNGQIKVTLIKDDYVELFVEKEGYNPYIDVIEVTGEEKIVHVKQPSDDIDIYAVMFDLDSIPLNILTSDAFIYLEALGTYWANFTYMANVPIDIVRLYADDTVVYSFLGDTIYGFEFTKDMIGKNFYVEIVYDGIVSKKVLTKLKVVEEPASPDSAPTSVSSAFNPFDDNDSGQFLNGLSIDLGDILDINKKIKSDSLDLGLDLDVNWNWRTGVFTIQIGFSLNFKFKSKLKDSFKEMGETRKTTDEMLKMQSKLEEYETDAKLKDQEYEKLKNEWDALSKKQQRQNEELQNRKSEAATELRDAQSKAKKYNRDIKNFISQKEKGRLNLTDFRKKMSNLGDALKLYENAFTQNNRGFRFGLEFIGVFEWNFYQNRIESLSLTIDGKFSYTWEGIFFAGYVPMFYSVKVEAKIGAKLNIFTEKDGWLGSNFWEYILIHAGVGIEGELGVGSSYFIGISFFLGASYDISGYLIADGFWQKDDGTPCWTDNIGTEFEVHIGVRLKLFLLGDIDLFKYQHEWKNDYNSVDVIHNNKVTQPKESVYKNAKSLSLNCKAASYEKFNHMIDERILSNGTYDCSKVKVDKIDSDKYVATWIDVMTRDGCVDTVLKYSIYEFGKWSKPQNINCSGSDFYHDTYFDGEKLRVVWQKIGSDFSQSDDLLTLVQNSEIYYAEFDSSVNGFSNITKITNNTSLDFAPRFVIKEKGSDSLAIVWQKNSRDDIVGITGKNSIVYSEYENNTWNNAKEIASEDSYISFVNSAYIDGQISVAYIFMTDQEGSGYVKNLAVAQNDKKVIFENFSQNFNNPQFYTVDGINKLFVYDNGTLKYSEDLENFKHVVELDGYINDTFKIVDSQNYIYFYYYKLYESTTKPFVSFYDKKNGLYQVEISLIDDNVSVKDISLQCLGDEKVIFAYITDLGDHNELKFGTNEFIKDYEVEEIYFNLNNSVEQNKIFYKLINKGDLAITEYTVTVFDNFIDISFDQPLISGDCYYGEISYKLDKTYPATDIKFNVDNIEKIYSLKLQYSDLTINGEQKFLNQIQYIDIALKNEGDVKDTFAVNIYCNGIFYKNFECSLLEGEEKIFKYSSDSFIDGDIIKFEIVSDNDKYDSDNIYKCQISKIITPIAQENPYLNLLNGAKYLL